MKPLTRLDYAIFQLTPTRTRFELYVSAGGKTERLAAGLLGPFLQHLRTAEEQLGKGGYSIRLEPPDPNAAAWFTKGTMDRFVRFVSTPEVLERVSIVELELTQLEETINAQVTEPSQADDQFPQSAGSHSLTGAKFVAATTTEKTTPVTKTRRNSMDSIDIGVGENSKMQLLRALDSRRMVLQKEQGMAFARAAAAGFNVDSIADLVVFAEVFGAARLREACTKFVKLCKKRQEAGLWLDDMDLPTVEAASNRSDMSYIGIVGSYAKPRDYPDTWSDIDGGDMKLDELRNESQGYVERRICNGRKGANGGDFVTDPNGEHLPTTHARNREGMGIAEEHISSGYRDSETGRANVVVEGHPFLPLWQGPPQQFVQNAYPPYGAAYSSPQKHLDPSHVVGGSHSSGLQYNPQYVGPFLQPSPYSDQNSGSPWQQTEGRIKTVNAQSEDEVADQEIIDKEELSPTEISRWLTGRSSPKKRSPSPHRKVQIGRSGQRHTGMVVIRNINYIASNSQDNPNKDGDEGDHSSASGSEESDSELYKTDETTAKAVRVSVQDVIGLFENKGMDASDSKKKSGRSSEKLVPRKCADDSTLESNAENQEESDPMSQMSQKHILQDEGSELLHYGFRQSSQRSTPAIAEIESETSKNRKISSQSQLGGLESSQTTQEVLMLERHGTSGRLANFNGSNVFTEQQGPASQVRPTIDDSLSISEGTGQQENIFAWKKRIPVQGLESLASQNGRGFAEQQLMDKMTVDDSFIVPARDMMDHEQATKSWRTSINMESEMGIDKNFTKQFATSSSEMVTGFEPNDLLMVPERNKESVGKSWNNAADYDIEGHSRFNDDNQQSVGEENKSPNEQYKEKREAKLRGEPVSKRTERMSKLKVMQEMLEKRKSDLAKSSKPQKASPLAAAQMRAEKLRAYKADLQKSKKEKEEEDRRRLEEMKIQRRERIAARSGLGPLHTRSASSTPNGSKSQMGAVRHGLVSKLSPLSQKSAVSMTSMPNSSVRVSSSLLSRGTTMKGSSVAGVPPSSHRSSIAARQANTVVTPVSRSVPSLTDLRRESSRTSSVHSSVGSQRSSQAKNSVRAGNSKFVKEKSTIPRSSVTRESKLQGSTVKTSTGTVTIPKGQGFLTVKHAKDLPGSSKQAKGSKIADQDAKSFLKRSGNTVCGTGGGTSKQKIMIDEKQTVSQQVISPLPRPEVEQRNGVKAVMVPEIVDKAQSTLPDEVAKEPGYGTDMAPVSCVSESRVVSVVPTDQASSDYGELSESVEVSKNAQQEVSDMKGVLFLHDSKLEENCGSDIANSRSTQTRRVLHDSGNPEPTGEQDTPPGASTMVFPVSGPSAQSLPQLQQLLSQTEDSWKSEPTKSRKKWGSSEISYPAGSEIMPKEAPKGLKRLLIFTKKSSGNTGPNSLATLERDEDGHERRKLGIRSMDDLGSKAHSVNKGSSLKWPSNGRSHDPGFVTDSKVYEKGSVNPARSSAMLNSRQQEDDLSGGSSVKASRSFFSLSTFRSKGGEGKS